MLIFDGNFRQHLVVYASELFIYIYIFFFFSFGFIKIFLQNTPNSNEEKSFVCFIHNIVACVLKLK